MRVLWLTTVAACVATAYLAGEPNLAPQTAPHGVAAKACVVTGKEAKVQDACAVGGMKLIGKFNVSVRDL